MPRVRPPDRMEQLLEAAAKIFMQKGLIRTRMSDIAKEMGVAQGTLYTYVESKETLFYILIERGARPDPIQLPDELPIPAPDPDALSRLVKRKARKAFVFPKLEAAVASRRVTDPHGEFTEIVEELYDRIEKGRRTALMIQSSSLDVPELAEIWFLQERRALFQRLQTYIERRVQLGHFRPLPDYSVAARHIIETLIYWGRRRFNDPFPLPLPASDVIRQTVVPLVVSGYLTRGKET